jgi:hypothetical protein
MEETKKVQGRKQACLWFDGRFDSHRELERNVEFHRPATRQPASEQLLLAFRIMFETVLHSAK